MLKRLEDKATSRSRIEPPSVEPFNLPRPPRPRSRPVLIDAAVCFLATALGSLSPQALSLLDLAPAAAVVGQIETSGAKFTDRVLIGGLQPLSWDEPAAAKPAFTKVSAPATAGEAPAPARAAPLPPTRPTRELASRKVDKAPEPKLALANPESSPAAALPPAADAKPAPDVVAEAKPATAVEPGPLSALAPARLTSKLAPVGEKMVNGVKAVGGALASGLSWIGY